MRGMMKNIQAKKAWEFLEKHRNAVLIDVRTSQEWAVVGLPDLSSLGRHTLKMTWSAEMIEEFRRLLETNVPHKETPLFFLCRSGMRSHHASELACHMGYTYVNNITDGFEDCHGPGTGWRASGLPFKLYSAE